MVHGVFNYLHDRIVEFRSYVRRLLHQFVDRENLHFKTNWGKRCAIEAELKLR